jgi:Helix-turn-helix domain
MSTTHAVEHLTDTTRIQVRSHRRAQWFWLDNAIIDTYGQALGPIGIALYVGLCRYASSTTGQCWPSLVRLSQQLGITHLTARRYLEKLVTLGLIAVEPRPGTTAIITILDMPDRSLPGNEVSHEDSYDVTGGRYDVTRGSLPGNTEPDLLNQTIEPAPKPPENALAMGEEANLKELAPLAYTPLTTSQQSSQHAPAPRTAQHTHGTVCFPWERPGGPERPDDGLQALDTQTYAGLAIQAKAALLAEGMSPWYCIQPVIETRMVALWEAQTHERGARQRQEAAA